MKKLALLLGIFGLGATLSVALTLPIPKGYVSDTAGLLDPSTVQMLESTLSAFQASTTNEIAVVTIAKLEGDTIETAATSLFEAWGIGKSKQDNGILLLISRDDRELRIEVGYGLEGALPDALASQIIRNEITPRFKDGDYDGGVVDGVNAILKAISGEYKAESQVKTNGFFDENIFGLLLFFLYAIGQSAVSYLAKSKSWWQGGILGALAGAIIGFIFFNVPGAVILAVAFTVVGLILDFVVSSIGPKGFGSGIGGGGFGGGFGTSSGGGFGGFGGGSSGGGGASGRW